MKKSKGFKSRGAKPNSPPKEASFHRTVIGIHGVMEALKVHPQWVQEVWLKEGAEDHPPLKNLLEKAKASKVSVKFLGPKRLDALGSGHQGVAAQLSKSPEFDERLLDSGGPGVCLALDQVTDPHNLGAILRSAWLLGTRAIYVPEQRSAGLTPTVSKVAQGGAEHVPVVVSSPLDQELKRLKDKGYWVFGLSHKGEKNLFEMDLPEKVVWVLGAEGAGLRKPVERACDELVSIPQAEPSASFNVSVAAGLALAETHRQHFFSKASK